MLGTGSHRPQAPPWLIGLSHSGGRSERPWFLAYDVVGFGADIWFTIAGICGLLLAATSASWGQQHRERLSAA